MSQLPQVRANAAWVAESFGKQSGIVPFAPPESIAYLDGYLDRQGAAIKAVEGGTDKVVSLLGAYLGECIIATYGGAWQESEESLAILIRAEAQLHLLKPFHKVYKRIVNGREDSLIFYFSDLILRVLVGGPRPAVPGAAPDPAGG